MITIQQLKKSIAEAQRFIAAAERAKTRIQHEDPHMSEHHSLACGNKDTASCRRASLDLSRTLAELRKP